jgi:hypothetical protein
LSHVLFSFAFAVYRRLSFNVYIRGLGCKRVTSQHHAPVETRSPTPLSAYRPPATLPPCRLHSTPSFGYNRTALSELAPASSNAPQISRATRRSSTSSTSRRRLRSSGFPQRRPSPRRTIRRSPFSPHGARRSATPTPSSRDGNRRVSGARWPPRTRPLCRSGNEKQASF